MLIYGAAAPPAGKTLGLVAVIATCYVAALVCFARRVP
jgi:hypothetical protein